MIDTRLGYTRFPADRRVQAVYWPKIARLPVSKEEEIESGNTISPLRSTLLSTADPLVDLVLLTLPEQHLHDYREGKEPPFVTRHQLGPIILSKLPGVLTTRTLINDQNFVHGGVPGIDTLGTVGHIRLLGKRENSLEERVDPIRLNSARRDDAVDMMNQQWLLDYVMEAGITGNRVMPFTRLVGAFIGFHMPNLRPQEAHPWL